MTFVDTSAWFAVMVPTDRNYPAAARWFAQNTQPLVTTDYVVGETLTLLRARGEKTRVLTFGQRLFTGGTARIHYVGEADVLQAWQVFQQFADKDWSFTDCTSKVVMEKLGVKQAFAFDQHFRQFGSVAVLP
jgi:uncharacterized protein